MLLAGVPHRVVGTYQPSSPTQSSVLITHSVGAGLNPLRNVWYVVLQSF